MSKWFINKTYALNIQKAFQNIDQILNLNEATIVSTSSISRVMKYSLADKIFYIKCYFARGKKWRKYFGLSRFQTELNNLIFCQHLHINIPNIVAYGESKKWFGIKSQYGIIITEEVANAIDLKTLAFRNPEFLQHKPFRIKVIQTIADYLKKMHKENFIHYDLQWRNILVTKSMDDPKVFLFDIPCGRIRKLSLRHGIKRDFYNLYKSAQLFLSRTDLLRFYLHYKMIHSLQSRDKQLIRDIVAYFLRKEYGIKESGVISRFLHKIRTSL